MNNKPSHNFPTPGLNTHLYLYNIRKQFLYFFKLHFLFNGKIWISDHTHKQNVLTIFYWIPISVLWHNLTKPDMEFVEVHMDEWTSRWQCSAATENWEHLTEDVQLLQSSVTKKSQTFTVTGEKTNTKQSKYNFNWIKLNPASAYCCLFPHRSHSLWAPLDI